MSVTQDARAVPWCGTAAHGHTPFATLLITQVDDTLWQGGTINGLQLPSDIVHVVTVYPWEAYKPHSGVRSFLAYQMYDSTDQDLGAVVAVADWVNHCRADGPTLVLCQAGLNRSSVVVALALVRQQPPVGQPMAADAAIAHVRAARSPACLCNPAFEAWVRAYGA